MIQRHSYQFILLFVILTFVGIAFVPLLSIQLNPSQSASSLSVSYVLPNGSPLVIEQQVTSKIEAALSTLQGVKEIKSNSGYNYGFVNIELDKKANLDQLRFEVAMLIRQLYPSLPKEVSYPEIQLNSPDASQKQEPFMILQFSGSGQATELSRYADERIKPNLASIKGIYEVNSYGTNHLEWVIAYKKAEFDAWRLRESDVLLAVSNHFKQESLGIKNAESGKTIHVILKNETQAQWKIPIINQDNRIIYLTDIAHIYQHESRITQFYRINGNNALNLIIVADKGSNQIELATQIKEKLNEIRNLMPSSYSIGVEYDSSEFVIENLQKIAIQSGLAIIILLLFVGLTVRRWWYLGLITGSLIVNLALSFILFYIFKVEIHLYSLAALTTSLGIIIDNTIVMIDHYQRHRNLKVFMGLLGATLTTVSGLVVIFFLPEESRLDLGDFSWVMLITLLISLPVALFFIPSVMERMKVASNHSVSNKNSNLRIKIKLSHLYFRFISWLMKYRKITFLIAILLFGTPIYLLPDKIDEKYKWANVYNGVFDNDWYQETAKPILNKWLGGTLRLFTQFVYESSYFQSPERTVLYVNAGLPNNSTIEQMDDIFAKLESKVIQYKEVDKCITQVYNAQNGTMRVYFTTQAEESGFAYQMKSLMIQLSTEMSGIDWDIYGVGQGFSQSINDAETPTFQVKMSGYNYNELERQAIKLKGILEKHPRVQEVNINKSLDWSKRKNLFEYTLKSDDRHLAIMDVSKINLSNSLLQQSYLPQPDLYLLINQQYYPLKIIPIEAAKKDLWEFENQTFKIDSSTIKLSEISSISKEKVIPEILKEAQQYIRNVSFTYYGSSVFGGEFLEKTLSDFNEMTPLGYKAQTQTYNWLNEDKNAKIWLIGLVILLIYIICAIIFESLIQPLALILLIPLSFIGVFLTFYWFDFNFDQGGYASFILLSGNVVCAAIFIISEYNILKKKYSNLSDIDLYIKAFNHKIIPIFSTVISTVVGLIPFLIYGEKEPFWFAFGVGTIGGLLMSLIVISIYLPLFLNVKRR